MKEWKRIRVLIADDHEVLRVGLASLINRQPDMRVVAEAANGDEAVKKFEWHHPDVGVLDFRMPEMNGIHALSAILEKVPEARIILLSAFGEDEKIYQAVCAGAQGYLRKDASLESIVHSIRSVYFGERTIQTVIPMRAGNRGNRARLSPRELQVLRLLVAGRANKQIASQLNISEGTVKIHVNHVMRKLQVKGRAEAIHEALKRGIVDLE